MGRTLYAVKTKRTNEWHPRCGQNEKRHAETEMVRLCDAEILHHAVVLTCCLHWDGDGEKCSQCSKY